MIKYKCNCGNTADFFIEHNLSQCGLYCGECGKWQKWLNKDEERLFKHKQSINEHDAKVRAEAIDEFAQMLINPSNYERFDFDDCLTDSGKANDFFKYVFAMAEQLKEQKNGC